jgi:hypothetical protein
LIFGNATNWEFLAKSMKKKSQLVALDGIQLFEKAREFQLFFWSIR